MSYCNIGDKPKVYFKFNEQQEQIYQSKESPIDVSMEDYSIYGATYKPEGYRINIYSTNNFGYYNLTVRRYEIVDRGAAYSSDDRYELLAQTCNSSEMVGIFLVNPSTLSFNYAITCPTVIPDIKKSRLHVKKAGLTTDIFTTEGDYPGSFKVSCGDCPDGTCRCETDSYPGYCCCDCNSLAGQVRQIKNTVSNLNSKGKVKYG